MEKKTNQNRKNVNIKMSHELYEKFKEHAKKSGLTVSGMIKYLISKEINKKGS